MHIEVLQTNLLSALKHCVRFLSSKPQLPILSCFYIETTEKEIWIISTDLHTGIRQQVEGTIQEPGTCVVPAKVLMDLVSSLSGKITLSLSGTALTVETANASSVINTLLSEDFPPFPQADGNQITLPFDFFSKIVTYVSFAAGKDETRPILTSILFSLSEKTLAVATDGYRLALYDAALSVSPAQHLLFPAKSIEEVTKIMQTESVKEVPVTLSEGLKQAFFTLPHSQVVLRILEGDFPTYEKIVPQTFEYQIHVDAGELEQHIKSAMIFSSEGSQIVQLSFFENTIEVCAKSSVLGEYKSSLPARVSVESTLKIAFNGRFILDFLQKISGKECVIKCNDPLKPVAFFCTDVPGLTYIAMPFRLNE